MPSYEDDAIIRSWNELVEYWREDIRVNRGLSRPGARAMIMYRLGVWQRGLKPGLLNSIVYRMYRFLHIYVRNRYGIELHATSKVGRRLFIAHQSGIVLHENLVIGDDCKIRQGVTFAGLRHGSSAAKKRGQRGPIAGSRVEIGAGAVIVGNIIIGDDVMIGPNAVVMRNVPSGSVVTTMPARILSRPQGHPTGEDREPSET